MRTPPTPERREEKRREYKRRVLEVEHGSFTPLVLSTSGGWGPSATVAFRRLAGLIATKHNQAYSTTLQFIRCKISFSLIDSASMCHVHPSMPRQMTSTFVINHWTSSAERPSWVARSPSPSQNLNTINSNQIRLPKHCSLFLRLDVYVLLFYLPSVYLRQCACVPGSNYYMIYITKKKRTPPSVTRTQGTSAIYSKEKKVASQQWPIKRQLLFSPCMYFFLLAQSCTFMQYTCTVHCCHYTLLNYTSGYSCRLMDLGYIHASCVLLTPARCTTICTTAIYIRVRKL